MRKRPRGYLRGLRIEGALARGEVDCLTGPELDGLMRTSPFLMVLTGADRSVADAVAHGVSECFEAWQDGVTVPSLAWYPTFASFPGSHAPPTANVPMPLVMCTSAHTDRLTKRDDFYREMLQALPNDLEDEHARGFLLTAADKLAGYFFMWLITQLVTGVIGSGPVPSFAPPGAPAGAVVAGSIVESPVHFNLAPLRRFSLRDFPVKGGSVAWEPQHARPGNPVGPPERPEVPVTIRRWL